MDKELLDFTAGKVDEMLAAPSASATTKAAAQAWKDAVAAGQDAEAATKALMDAISEHQTTVDSVIAFFSSDAGKQLLGDGQAAAIAREKERKARGAKWCDCAACRPCHELLAKFGREEPDLYL